MNIYHHLALGFGRESRSDMVISLQAPEDITLTEQAISIFIGPSEQINQIIFCHLVANWMEKSFQTEMVNEVMFLI